jgi:uncharacterized protein (DUF58 family)
VSEALKYLKPDVVAQLGTMELKARLVVEGFITGLHRSPYHGFSVEFTEHRPYMPGDDLKRLDWKVLGKTDRYFIKQFEEETNLKSYLILDASRSMNFSSGRHLPKIEYAKYLAASLAYLMTEQRDAVGLTVYGEAIASSLPPRSTRLSLYRLLRELEQVQGGRGTRTAEVLHQVAEQIKRRGLVIILSDLLDEAGDVLNAFKHFRHRGHEVLVLHILDPQERLFGFGSDAVFRDMETGEELPTQPWHIRDAYREAFQAFLDRYRHECLESNIDYVLLDTSTPFDTALLEYLNKRKRMH